jgi:hypothetical protein
MSVVLPFLLRLVRVICLVIFEAKIISPFAYFLFHDMYINFMSVVYFSLLLFVRIEQNVKIYNTLHLVFFTGYTYKI